jgi:dTDP-4-dehydrorhamnose reductase
MRILVTGKEGQVGWELRRTLAVLGEVIAVDRTQLDLSNPEQAASVMRDLKPNVIVNAAAYTAVDKAESEEGLARAINALTPGAMAAEAKKLGALFIHYSTDYVFDGTATKPYIESDNVAPVSAYGRTKEEGERLIRESGANHLILRTAWVYGIRGKNFLLTMLRLAKERDRLRVVGDQIGSPTWSRLIAEATAALISQAGDKPVQDTLNLTSQGHTSWQGFASAIVEHGAKLGLCPPIPIDAIGTEDYPTPAHRPAYSVLSGDKLKANYSVALPDWNAALQLCLADLRS